MTVKMIKNFKASKIDFFISGFFATTSIWVLLAATPYLRLGGFFIQVETQILYLHSFCSLMLIYKIYKSIFLRKSLKDTENDSLLSILVFSIATISLILSIINNSFLNDLLGTPQLGQGILWYFDLYIMITVFSSFLLSRKGRILMFFNLLILTSIATIFTIKPYFMKLNISFYNFTDYLCFYGSICFILLTTITKNRLLLFLGYILLGLYFLPLGNNSAYLLWIVTLSAALIYYLFDLFKKYNFLNTIKNFLYSNLALTSYILIASFLIVLSSIIFWSGEYGIPEEIKKSSLSSLVVRGKIAETSLLSLLDLDKLLFGNGWGQIPYILLANMNAWHYDQLTLGYNLHFHTHNELIEHFVSLGLFGFILFILLMYNIFKFAEHDEIFTRLSWFLFLMLTCFWFLFAGTLPALAIVIASLSNKANSLSEKNILYNKLLDFKKRSGIILHSLILIILISGTNFSYKTIKMHDKLSTNALLSYAEKRDDNNYECKNYFKDYDRGGYMLAPMINNYTNYFINIEKDDINENSAKLLKLLFCLAEEVIVSGKANLDLISTVMQAESRLYFSEYEELKNIMYSKDDISLWKKNLYLIAEFAPKRGDLLIPSMGYFIEKGKSSEVLQICNNKLIKGVEAYCELVFAFGILKNNRLSKTELNTALEHLESAVDKGILEEKIYGWWYSNSIEKKELKGFSKDGIPLSPDLLFHVSHEESMNIIAILNNHKKNNFK